MSKIDKDKAQSNPAAVFNKPDDIVKNRELTAREKTKALQEWELDARLTSVAAEEGMTKDDDKMLDKPKKSPLPEIKKAQEDMGIKPDKGVEHAPNKT
jgi:hypothetical protein